MDLREITEDQIGAYNSAVTHIIQSWEWGEFRKKLGLPVLRFGIFKQGRLSKAFTLTLHKIPFTKYFVGYLPKGPLPDKELSTALEIIGKQYSCAFIKIEPNVPKTKEPYTIYPTFLPSPKPLFTRFNFLLDLKKSEEELLKSFHSKTRYNIKVAQKKGVKVKEQNDEKGFKTYLKLYFETTARQSYFGHNINYHRKAWETLNKEGLSHILIAYYKKEPLTAWMLVQFKDTLYYPYGGSSDKHREVMSSNLVAWEAIRLGQKLGCEILDMWGALGPEADPKDPWFGFHRFKQGYGGNLVEYVGSFDLIFNTPLYFAFTTIDKLTRLKVMLLKLVGK
jgi:lipid II:glycine glycyltransferase (peptidoglycan interpeptide bridge formation enzyme)